MKRVFWGPRRIFNAARFLYMQRISGFQVPSEPHFDEESSELFRCLLAGSHSYLEYGAGGSTIMAAKLGIPSISVESDRFFARAVGQRIGPDAAVTIVSPSIGFTLEWSYPVFRSPTSKRRARWLEYVQAPFESLAASGDAFPDFALIDGRFRVACALEIARQAQIFGSSTTIFFDDFNNRPTYRKVIEKLGTPRIVGRAAVFNTSTPVADVSYDDVVVAARDPA